MEARGKIFTSHLALDLVTVYTQFGYATVDLEKFKESFSATQSKDSSPEKTELGKEDSKES